MASTVQLIADNLEDAIFQKDNLEFTAGITSTVTSTEERRLPRFVSNKKTMCSTIYN
jgi:hypothetical protein